MTVYRPTPCTIYIKRPVARPTSRLSYVRKVSCRLNSDELFELDPDNVVLITVCSNLGMFSDRSLAALSAGRPKFSERLDQKYKTPLFTVLKVCR
jgi:hypothetical protein